MQSGDRRTEVDAEVVEALVTETADLTVEAAVRADLERIAQRDPDVAQSTLAASALVLARQMDCSQNSATSKSMCGRTLLDTMNRLAELAPDEEVGDRLDDLAARRQKRVAA